MPDVGCGFPTGVDYTYCGWLGMLCARCKSAGAGAETSDGSGLQGRGVPTSDPVDGFTPAPVDPLGNGSRGDG